MARGEGSDEACTTGNALPGGHTSSPVSHDWTGHPEVAVCAIEQHVSAAINRV